ncbi:hypothetical protein NOCA2220151 [metagenome]|uniref:Uncharacterized protein n=1 Tax=metagenome TaxID=256318 RepID=A0A2P2BYX4_9ZZZZ
MAELDMRQVFEASFDSEPPLREIQPTLVAGRSAVRRRHGLTAAAVAVVCAATFSVTRLIGTPTAEPAPLERPTPSAPSTPSTLEQRLTTATAVDESWQAACGHAGQPSCAAYARGAAPVSIGQDGALLRTSDGVVIAQKSVDSTTRPGVLRIEVEVRTPDSIHPRWWLLTRRSGTVTAAVADPARSAIDFSTWASSINSGTATPGAPPSTPARVILSN